MEKQAYAKSDKMAVNSVLWFQAGGSIRKEEDGAAELGENNASALPFELQANSSVVYEDAIMHFDDALKFVFKQSNGQCELYHMFSTILKTFEDCETKKCVLQQTAPLKYLLGP